MIGRLRALFPGSVSILERASEVVGRDLQAQYAAGNPSMFAFNRDVQVGVFLTNHVYMELLHERGVRAEHSAGLSLGEYNHLVHIGALGFEDALRLVDARGKTYDAGPAGIMACVFPLPLADLERVVDRARSVGCVEIANLNSPMQHVLSGEGHAVQSALRILEDEHCVEGVVIEDRIPMHSSIFAPVVEEFRPHLERAPWRMPGLPYLPNVAAELIHRPGRAQFVEMLSRHVCQPVRWRESVDLLADTLPEPVFVEVGPRGVLSNLLSKKWRPFRKYRTDGAEEPAAAAAHLEALVEELTRVPAAL